MNRILALVEPNVSIGKACLIAVVCIVIVFSMLALLWGIVGLFKFLPKKKTVAEPVKKVATPSKKVSMEDIKDEDMLVASIVASIDYHNETKQDVRVVSVKEL